VWHLQMECALAAIVQAVRVGILEPGDRVVVVDGCAVRECGDACICAAVSFCEDVAAIEWLVESGTNGGRCGQCDWDGREQSRCDSMDIHRD
jgi:hypothetical protein